MAETSWREGRPKTEPIRMLWPGPGTDGEGVRRAKMFGNQMSGAWGLPGGTSGLQT